MLAASAAMAASLCGALLAFLGDFLRRGLPAVPQEPCGTRGGTEPDRRPLVVLNGADRSHLNCRAAL
jgi:hypothetical protein